MVDNGIINKFEKINVNEIVPKIYRIIGNYVEKAKIKNAIT